MAQEVLNMKEEAIDTLKNTIVDKRFVNCYSREFSPEKPEKLKQFLSQLKDIYKHVFVRIDIREFEQCEDEEQEVEKLQESINRELTTLGLTLIQLHAFTIASALSKWSDKLDDQALLVFHCFHDRYSEKEKDILRVLRKTLSNKDELSGYLGILIVSNREVFRWELFPESNLDERHILFFDFNSSAED